jgi:hypothetical protein
MTKSDREYLSAVIRNKDATIAHLEAECAHFQELLQGALVNIGQLSDEIHNLKNTACFKGDDTDQI